MQGMHKKNLEAVRSLHELRESNRLLRIQNGLMKSLLKEIKDMKRRG